MGIIGTSAEVCEVVRGVDGGEWEAPLSDGIDSVIGTEMTDTVFKDPADLLI